MNRKVTLLLIAAVTAILPAVAVADVMITGNVLVSGTQNTPVFVIQPGPNYATANMIGAIGWTPSNGATVGTDGVASMGTVDLEGIANETTALANVLDLNVTISSGVTGTLYVNFTGDFPGVGLVWISTSQMSVQSVMSQVGGQPLNGTSFSFSGTFSGGTTTYYISFYLPASNAYVGTSGTITGTFIAS